MKAEQAQPQPQAEEQPQDLDPEIVHLRRALAEAEVARDNLDMKASDLTRDLRQTREALTLGERRIAHMESTTESLITALKDQADEAQEARNELERTQAALSEKSDTVEGLVESFMATRPR